MPVTLNRWKSATPQHLTLWAPPHLPTLHFRACVRCVFVDQAVLKEVTSSEGQIVMFIDEIHTVVGAGAQSGSMDASNLLKPMLARGELRCIGATTLNEYKQVWLKRRYCSEICRDRSIVCVPM